eukprot:1548627-Rhodomonas_salina.2
MNERGTAHVNTASPPPRRYLSLSRSLPSSHSPATNTPHAPSHGQSRNDFPHPTQTSARGFKDLDHIKSQISSARSSNMPPPRRAPILRPDYHRHWTMLIVCARFRAKAGRRRTCF